MSLKLKDLKEAKYNPRVISPKQLANLAKSMLQYGDLSGVVFNKKSGVVIAGHQRLKTLRDAGFDTTISTKKVKDKHGTVEEGYILAKTEHGELRLPLRVVNWSDKTAEMAANIAANAHGGDFDREKLGALLTKIKPGEKFDVDLLGLDPLTVRTLLPKMADVPRRKNGGGDDDGDVDENGGTFQSFGEDSFQFDHTCPKCKFQYNESDALKAAKKKHKEEQADKPKSKKSKKLDKAEKSKKDKSDSKKKKVKRPVEDAAPKKKKKKGLAEKLAAKKKKK